MKICCNIFIYCSEPEIHGALPCKYAALFSSIVVPRRGMRVYLENNASGLYFTEDCEDYKTAHISFRHVKQKNFSFVEIISLVTFFYVRTKCV